MKTKLMTKLFLLALGALLLAVPASAGPVALPYQTWATEPFTLMNPGDMFPTVFSMNVSGSLNITGYYETGDYYQVYDNGTLVLTTTQVLPIDVDYGDQVPSLYATPQTAFTSGLFSVGHVSVQAGDWITIADLHPPGGIGEAGLLLTPEPAAVIPAAFGLLALAFVLRRRHFAPSR